MADQDHEPVAVLGLGRFGQALCLALTREGVEVLAIDHDPGVVMEMNDSVTLAVEADVTSKQALIQLGVTEYTRAVVAVGDVEANLVCALLLKDELKIPEIWVKAMNTHQAKILRKIGVTDVIYPELEVGRRLAHTLIGHRTEYLPTVDGLAYAGLTAPPWMVGQRLGEIAALNERGILVMGISRAGRGMPEIATSNTLVRARDVLIVCGPQDEVSPLLT